MAPVFCFRALPYFAINPECKSRFSRVRAGSSDGGDKITVPSSEFVSINGISLSKQKEQTGVHVDGGNGKRLKSTVEKTFVKDMISNEVGVLWDDGFRSRSVKDYIEESKEIIKPDGGPPRWFSPVECGRPVKDAPNLLFLPGLDGVGSGLILHQKALGKAFHVWCLHIPVYDRTPFEGLVKLVEETVRLEHASHPNKPIYLVGDSFGGCLALSVAARNPAIDLVLILANPATSFGRSQLQPLLPFLEALPDELHFTVPYALSFIMGEPVKMAMVTVDSNLPPGPRIEQLSGVLTSLLPLLSGLTEIMPKKTLTWKLKLLERAAAYANSRLHAVKAQVLVLASGKDNMLPSLNEAKRLKSSLKNCIVRCFMDNGHCLLLEDSISLLSVIRGTCLYRRSRKIDLVSDFLPPSKTELKYVIDNVFGTLRYASCPVMFSTLEDGTVVKGLAGVPDEGPVLLVGYHMLMGMELAPLGEAFLKEKKIAIRGVAHPQLFSVPEADNSTAEFSYMDWLKVFGALPVTASNLFKLLSSKSHVLLYPGGAREALHFKGEQYKLFWPDHQEFVRMAARFGATIVPFGTVGEDDLAELVLDYHDLSKIPVINDQIREINSNVTKLRDESSGEVANQQLFFPGLLPKIPGRFYYMFGKPIKTAGREYLVKDREKANKLYKEIQSDVERNLAYLLKKREHDPYRNILDRLVHNLINAPIDETPTFEP